MAASAAATPLRAHLLAACGHRSVELAERDLTVLVRVDRCRIIEAHPAIRGRELIRGQLAVAVRIETIEHRLHAHLMLLGADDTIVVGVELLIHALAALLALLLHLLADRWVVPVLRIVAVDDVGRTAGAG